VALLTASEYPAIRAAIDVTLDSELLPDATIGLPLYAGAAEAWVLSRLPTADSLAEPARTAAVRAAMWRCAALLVPAVPQIVSESTQADHAYTRQGLDIAKRVAQLMALAEEALAEATPADDVGAPMPTMFTLATGGRGR
jgi:hypothetical protein